MERIMSWGGARTGAGRPKGQGKYGVVTKPIRVPEDMIPDIENFIRGYGYELPLYGCNVSAGSPAPADDYIEDKVDLHKYLVSNPESSFLVKATGDSMIDAGIYSGDVLVVDRSVKPSHGKVVIAAIDGQLTVKRFYNKNGETYLQAENPDYSDIELQENNDLIIWGVVTSVLTKL
jgi:DNA polymerase V